MDTLSEAFFQGFESELPKVGVAPAAAAVAPVARAGGSRIMAALSKRPLLTAAGGAAAGAGAVTGVGQAKERREELAEKRKRVRQVLMARLARGGYYAYE